jgi:hypothetical protein
MNKPKLNSLGTKVTAYKDINIYVSNCGVFYCNIGSKDNRVYLKSSLHSSNLKNLMKGIDRFEGSKLNVPVVQIRKTAQDITEHVILRKVGNIINFEDGTFDRSSYKLLIFKEDVEGIEEIPKLKNIENELIKVAEEYRQLRKRESILRKDFNDLFDQLSVKFPLRDVLDKLDTLVREAT